MSYGEGQPNQTAPRWEDVAEWPLGRLLDRRQEVTKLMGNVEGRGEERKEELLREMFHLQFEFDQREVERDGRERLPQQEVPRIEQLQEAIR